MSEPPGDFDEHSERLWSIALMELRDRGIWRDSDA